jgi:hypothetical protein
VTIYWLTVTGPPCATRVPPPAGARPRPLHSTCTHPRPTCPACSSALTRQCRLLPRLSPTLPWVSPPPPRRLCPAFRTRASSAAASSRARPRARRRPRPLRRKQWRPSTHPLRVTGPCGRRTAGKRNNSRFVLSALWCLAAGPSDLAAPCCLDWGIADCACLDILLLPFWFVQMQL